MLDARDGVVGFAPDLTENLAKGDESFAGFLRIADAHVDRHGLALPAEHLPVTTFPEPTGDIASLDLRAAGIGSVIWATGYRYDFDWIDLDVFDPSTRAPRHRRGVTEVPGAYFLGLPMLHKTKSSFLSGVGEDADFLADRIADRVPTA